MDWKEKFITDAQQMFKIPKEKLEQFIQYMMYTPEKIQDWVEETQIAETDFLILATIYALYKNEDKTLEIITDLDLKVDEAIALASTTAAALLNALPPEDQKPVLAQLLLATALQLENTNLRNALAEYAKLLITQPDEQN